MELLATQELGREAKQTTDKIGGSEKTEREGRTQIKGGAEVHEGAVDSTKINNIHVINIYICLLLERGSIVQM